MDIKEASPSLPPPPTTTVDEGTIDTNDALNSETKIELAEFSEPEAEPEQENDTKKEPETGASEDVSDEPSDYGPPLAPEPDQNDPQHSPDLPPETDGDEDEEDEEEEEEEDEEEPTSKKQKQLSNLPKPESEITEIPSPADAITPQPQNGKPPTSKSGKKYKKKSKDVWSTTTRKAKKKTKHASNNKSNPKNATNVDAPAEDKMLMINPIPKFLDKSDDSPDLNICLSKVQKAEKIELSEDRLSAGSTKGYRMVRATRGVTEGAWYFEIKVVHLGETGHARLGWSTDKADLQAPVGFEGCSFGYRDADGSKVHKALRQEYGKEGYNEGDVIGVYINLPDGAAYTPDPPRMVWHKGQRFVCASGDKEDSMKVVPRSEISFFKNGTSQGVAFRDLYGGRYYPAASMYTLPNQPNCVVKFNFGPDFERFPVDFGQHPAPRPMIEVPYQEYGVENGGSPWKMARMPPMLKVVKDDDITSVEAAELVG